MALSSASPILSVRPAHIPKNLSRQALKQDEEPSSAQRPPPSSPAGRAVDGTIRGVALSTNSLWGPSLERRAAVPCSAQLGPSAEPAKGHQQPQVLFARGKVAKQWFSFQPE